MKNWLKNLLFVIFSFVFLGVGMLVANIFIKQKGNPLKDPNFLADIPTDTTTLIPSLPIDSTSGWLGDTVQVPEPSANIVAPNVENDNNEASSTNTPRNSRDYDVVIGIFGERSNAKKQVKKLKDSGYSDAYSYSKSSMDVVSAGRFSKNDAQKVVSELNEKGFDAILKRR